MAPRLEDCESPLPITSRLEVFLHATWIMSFAFGRIVRALPRGTAHGHQWHGVGAKGQDLSMLLPVEGPRRPSEVSRGQFSSLTRFRGDLELTFQRCSKNCPKGRVGLGRAGNSRHLTPPVVPGSSQRRPRRPNSDDCHPDGPRKDPIERLLTAIARLWAAVGLARTQSVEFREPCHLR